MEDVYASVQRGGTLAHPIEENSVFPPMVGHMVVGRRGDRSARGTCSARSPTSTRPRSTSKVKALTALIEPLMIVVVGGMVGFIVIAMYLPLFSLYDKIQ